MGRYYPEAPLRCMRSRPIMLKQKRCSCATWVVRNEGLSACCATEKDIRSMSILFNIVIAKLEGTGDQTVCDVPESGWR